MNCQQRKLQLITYQTVGDAARQCEKLNVRVAGKKFSPRVCGKCGRIHLVRGEMGRNFRVVR